MVQKAADIKIKKALRRKMVEFTARAGLETEREISGRYGLSQSAWNTFKRFLDGGGIEWILAVADKEHVLVDRVIGRDDIADLCVAIDYLKPGAADVERAWGAFNRGERRSPEDWGKMFGGGIPVEVGDTIGQALSSIQTDADATLEEGAPKPRRKAR